MPLLGSCGEDHERLKVFGVLENMLMVDTSLHLASANIKGSREGVGGGKGGSVRPGSSCPTLASRASLVNRQTSVISMQWHWLNLGDVTRIGGAELALHVWDHLQFLYHNLHPSDHASQTLVLTHFASLCQVDYRGIPCTEPQEHSTLSNTQVARISHFVLAGTSSPQPHLPSGVPAPHDGHVCQLARSATLAAALLPCHSAAGGHRRTQRHSAAWPAVHHMARGQPLSFLCFS